MTRAIAVLVDSGRLRAAGLRRLLRAAGAVSAVSAAAWRAWARPRLPPAAARALARVPAARAPLLAGLAAPPAPGCAAAAWVAAIGEADGAAGCDAVIATPVPFRWANPVDADWREPAILGLHGADLWVGEGALLGATGATGYAAGATGATGATGAIGYAARAPPLPPGAAFASYGVARWAVRWRRLPGVLALAPVGRASPGVPPAGVVVPRGLLCPVVCWLAPPTPGGAWVKNIEFRLSSLRGY